MPENTKDDKIEKINEIIQMKKFICLLLQAVSLCMLFIYIVDKDKIGLLFDLKTTQDHNMAQVIYILLTMTLLFISILGFLAPDKNNKK